MYLRPLALKDDVVAGGTHDLPVLQRALERFRNCDITGRDSGCVPAGQRVAATAVAGFAKRLCVGLAQRSVTRSGRRLYVTGLAGIRIPVRTVLRVGQQRQQQADECQAR